MGKRPIETGGKTSGGAAGEASYPHPAAFDEAKLLAQCEVGKGRSGGPGGQHRNKVETKVMLAHRPTGVLAQAAERRSAEENRRVAVFRLRLALASEVRCAVPAGDAWGDARSALWRRRCVEGRIVCNPEHEDYPSLLAEALDNVLACGLDEHKAAARLVCSVTQLVKFVKEHPPAMGWWNREREAVGRRGLR